jgi:hypothetical protein
MGSTVLSDGTSLARGLAQRAFRMVRLGGEWRIAALGCTVQREGCPPAPAGVSGRGPRQSE